MVTLVVTKGKGSMDLYAQKLAEKLHSPKVYTEIYQEVAKQFNIPFLCPRAMKAFWQDWKFIKKLNKLDSIIHRLAGS